MLSLLYKYFFYFQLKDVIKATINNDICIENCTIDSHSECEMDERIFNTITRNQRTIFEEVPHKNENKRHRNKINMKFEVRGKDLNDINSESRRIRLHNGYNITIHYNKKRYICPMGFVRRKNICGKLIFVYF